MFENIAELEKEVQEFRKNILASSALVTSLEKLIEQTKEHAKAVETTTVQLESRINQQTQTLQQQQQQASDAFEQTSKAVMDGAKKQSQTIQQQITDQTASIGAQIDKQNEAFAAAVNSFTLEAKKQASATQKHAGEQTTAINNEIQKQTKVFADAVKSLSDEMEHDTIALKGQVHETVEMAVARMSEENRKQMYRLSTAIEQAATTFSNDAKATAAALEVTQKNLSDRYERVIAKLESANLDESMRLSRKIIKSINVKFGILLVGTLASLVIAILAFLK